MSEYGSVMLENWNILEEAASFSASPSTTPTPPSRPNEVVATDSNENIECKPTQFHQIEGEHCSRTCSPLGDFVDAGQGNLPSLYYPATSSEPTPIKVLTLEIERDDSESNMTRQHKMMPDDQDGDVNDIETGVTTRYMVMDDVAGSNLMQRFSPLTHHVSARVPATVAMTFGITVILLHIIWIINH